MLKRMLLIAALALVVAVPAAVADSGTPQPAAPAAARGNGDRGKDVLQRLEKVRDRLQKVGAAFDKQCTDGKQAARCTTAAKRILERLHKIDGKLGTVIGKIAEHCTAGATSQAVPKACGRAVQLAETLRDVQSRVQQVEQKLQAWLGNHASTSDGSSGGPADAGDASGLETLDQLAGDLAAAQAQMP